MISIDKSHELKAIAALMMLCLHLFNNLNYDNLFTPLIFIGSKPLIYYISLFCDACIPIFAFVTGYGLYINYKKETQDKYLNKNFIRIKSIYINYWIILVFFVLVLGTFIRPDKYPGTLYDFLLNITTADTSYVGAWWYLTTYILFVLSSIFWFKLLDKLNPYLLFTILIITYFIAFYFRVYKPNLFSYNFLNLFERQSALYFCTLLQFMMGAFCAKYDWVTKFSKSLPIALTKNYLALSLIILLIIIHGLIPSFIVAPFTGLAFIMIYLQINQPIFIQNFLNFIGPHSTNIWLVHMLIYSIYFKNFVYSFKYPILIYSVLLIACIICSYGVNLVFNRINTKI